MEVKSAQLTILKILELKDRIDPKPQYQRTPVWKIDRKKLLIDSIFRGYDLPKFYWNTLSGNAFFDYEVCDGQQRLRTIWEFMDDKFVIGSDIKFNGRTISNKKYSQLDKEAKQHFDQFPITIATIKKAEQKEIRELFARLQKGMGLNQAELRRALSTNIGTYVESIVNNHKFFVNCGFSDSRNKHQDYIDHVIAFLVNDFKSDFKGQSLRDVYINVSPLQATQLVKNITLILNDMDKINAYKIGMFRNKWAFVDTFILIYQNNLNDKKIMHKEFSVAFQEFEKLRKANLKNPSKLIEKVSPTDEDKRLYEYITSFSKDGALKANMKRRNEAFSSQFRHLFK